MNDNDSNNRQDESTFVDHTFTRVLSQTFELDGVTFSWWAIDNSPAFVTVSTQWFGNKVALSHGDPEQTARELATQLLRDRNDRAARLSRNDKPKAE